MEFRQEAHILVPSTLETVEIREQDDRAYEESIKGDGLHQPLELLFINRVVGARLDLVSLQDVRPPGNIKVREDACERPEEGCIHNECAGHVQSEGIFANNTENVIPEVLPVVAGRPPEPAHVPRKRVSRALEDEDEAANDEDGPDERARQHGLHRLLPPLPLVALLSIDDGLACLVVSQHYHDLPNLGVQNMPSQLHGTPESGLSKLKKSPSPFFAFTFATQSRAHSMQRHGFVWQRRRAEICMYIARSPAAAGAISQMRVPISYHG